MDRDSSLNLTKLGPVGGLLGILGALGLGAGFMSEATRTATAQAYLWGWTFWAAVALGCLGLTMLHHAIRATWGLSVIRLLEAGGGPVSLAVTGVLFVPIILFLPEIFPWANPANAHEHIVHGKAWYLNKDFFILRQVVYFATWIFLANKARQSSLKQDETLDPALGVKRQTLGPIGLVTFFVTMTFAVTDWIMSLELNWYSSILPLLTCIGAALSALSLCIVMVLLNRGKQPYAQAITPQLTKDLGNMLFALTLLWQYMVLSQYLITWSGNLQEEIPYYIKRNDFGWNFLITANIVFQFFVPFLALLAPRTKRHAKNLLYVALLIFTMRLGDIYWTVMPSMRGGTLGASISHWQDYVAFLAMGGFWMMVFGSQLGKASILPKHDTRLLEVEHAH